MKLYRTRTQEEYDWLMQKLEDEGYMWMQTQVIPTAYNFFKDYKSETVIRSNNFGDLLCGTTEYYEETHPNEPIIEVSDLMDTKFKVGDEVRVVNAPVGLPEGELVGEIHKVTMVDNNKIPYELSNSFWCREGDIELVVDHDVLMQKVLERNNKPELVNHPDHYQGNKFEVIDIIEDYELNFTLGSAVKYILRAGKKDDKNTDLKKAIWMLERELEEEDGS